MNEQGYRFGVGVLVVASMVIAVILILFFGAAPNLFKEQYVVTIRFDAAPGVATDTPVRKNGVRIGRVKSIKLRENEALLTSGGVDLLLELDSQYRVYAGEQPQIGIESIITNDAVVEFRPPSSANLLTRFDGVAGSPANGILDAPEKTAAEAILKDGDFLSGGTVAPEPMAAFGEMQGNFASTLNSIERAANEITTLSMDFRTALGGSNGELQRITRNIDETFGNLNKALVNIDSLVSDPNLKETIAILSERLPALMKRADNVLGQTETMFATFEGVGQGLGGVVDNLQDFTEPFGQQGGEIASSVSSTVNNLDSLITDLRGVVGPARQLIQRITNGEGTLALLMEDPELYYSVVNSLQNIDTITRRLIPIVEDARVLSDKAARNPGGIFRDAVLGSRGGLK
ncbi:MAG TPA: hypothetical protein DDW52_17340 [Planctomycetaceae bacterium]|nr:hypothetical protein [Planctomycetaceae bacterium]